MMKMLAAVSCAFLIASVLGCSQQASGVPAAARPVTPPPSSTAAAPSGDVNTFGESRDPAADSAAQARAQHYGDAQDSSRQASSSNTDSISPPRR